MTVTVRRATPADAAALVAHLKALAAEPDINIPLAPDEITDLEDERDMLEEIAASPRAVMLVAIADGRVVGELSVRGISQRRAVAHVATLGMSVAAPWRRRGVGAALMTEVIAWADRTAFARIELYVYARNTAAIRLYEKFGFAVEGTRRAFIRAGDTFLDDLVMARLSGAARVG